MSFAKGFSAVLIAMLWITSVSAQTACPLTTADESKLQGVLQNHQVLFSKVPQVVVFKSGLEIDDDGAPSAYHKGLSDDAPDPGLDHICNGGDVLEYVGQSLVNRYADGGSIGAVSGVNAATGIRNSVLCKRDYIAIREAGFPACGPGKLCMRWYGVAVTPRSCGYNKAGDMGCGTPILQTDENGKKLDFYFTQNTLTRPGANSKNMLQSDYANPLEIPFIVMPGDVRLPSGQAAQAGDLAIVLRNGKTAYAVVGDQGPSNKLGEASRALLGHFGGGSVSAETPVTTILFPGTKSRISNRWPLDPAEFEVQGRALLEGLGSIADLKKCPGLETLH